MSWQPGWMANSETQIITRYMLPGFTSYIIVSLTLAIPNMILGETSLSFLGVGLRAPDHFLGSDASGRSKPADGRTNSLAALACGLCHRGGAYVQFSGRWLA